MFVPSGVPPLNELRQASHSAEPFTAPCTFVGALGASGAFTCNRTSFDGRLRAPPSDDFIRT